MKAVALLFSGLALIMAAGCSSLSSVASRTLTVDDITGMTTEGVSPEVIKRHIEVTRSRFDISSEEIIKLKRAGVKDDVITFMLDSAKQRGSTDFELNQSAEALYNQ